MSEVVVSGYLSLDRIILINNPLKIGHTSLVLNDDNQEIYYGGCPVNIASALNMYGVKTTPLMRVGNDFESTKTKAFFQSRDIPLEGIVRVENASSSNCYLIEDIKGQHHTIFYPGAMDDMYFQPYDEDIFKDAKIAIMTVGPKKDNEFLLKQAKKYDLELVFGSKLDLEAFPKEFISQVMDFCSILFVNEIEAEVLKTMYGLHKMDELFKTAKRLHTIVVTKGEKGSTLYEKKNGLINKSSIGIAQAEICEDTTGSGDAYIAGFMYGYIKGYRKVEACKLGAILASYIVAKKGCNTNTPNLSDLLDTYEEKGETL